LEKQAVQRLGGDFCLTGKFSGRGLPPPLGPEIAVAALYIEQQLKNMKNS
jgi:hypothetical protein